MLARPEPRPAATARPGEAMVLSAAATPTADTRLATATPTAGGDAASPTHLAFAAPPPIPEPRPEAVATLAGPVQQAPAPQPDLPQQALAFATTPELEARQPAIPLPPAFSRPAPGLRGPAREDQAVSRPASRPM